MDKLLMLQNNTSSIKSTVDEGLISEIASGDMHALHELYSLTANSIYGFALSITKNTHDAEDVLQDTFIIVHRKAKDYIPQGKVIAWLLTIARNLALMKLREHGKTAYIEDLELENSVLYSKIDDTDDALVLKAALSILDDEERQIVMLHSMTGLKFREISTLVNTPIGTVLSKYHRAIKKMRDHLKGEQ